jgi:hypothetical protein
MLLAVTIDFPPGVGAATVVSFSTTGAVSMLASIPLDANGDGSFPGIPFDPANVSKVVVVITNAGGRFTCNQATIFSCEGVALDDLPGFVVTASAL